MRQCRMHRQHLFSLLTLLQGLRAIAININYRRRNNRLNYAQSNSFAKQGISEIFNLAFFFIPVR